jgi:cell division transport system permease protein
MKSFEQRYNTKRYRAAYNTTVVSITLVLFLLGLVLLLVLHTGKLSSWFRENIGVSVVFDKNAGAGKILAFKSHLDTQQFVRSTKYISKQEAAEQLKAELGEDFVEFIGYNPLPPTLEVFLHHQYTYSGRFEGVEKFLLQNEIVESVEYQHTLVALIEKNISVISRWILIFSLLLLVVSVLLIHNTIRLAVYSKRMLIKSMLLIGATQGFIRKPFFIRGILQGLLSGCIAVGMLSGILFFVHHKLPALHLLDDWLTLGAAGLTIIVFGMIITWISNFIAIKKYLKIDSEDLY